ncbi:MAG: fumarylacetoacetate hydrolase family protein [Planctomycetota bacterium]
MTEGGSSIEGSLLPRVERRRSPEGRVRWLLAEQDSFRDLTAAGAGDPLADLAARLLDRAGWESLCAQAPSVEARDWTLLRPGRPGKALCLGKNFAAHAREFGAEPPRELVWFAKLPDVLTGPGEAVVIPAWLETRVDPEAEAVVLIGARLLHAGEDACARAIAAWTLGNDVTARKQQGLDRQQGWPWLRCKNLATFGPLGPGWVPAFEIPDPAGIRLRGKVNGEVRQEAPLADLIWPPARALAEICRWTPLEPGDILFLGTPAGVAPIRAGDRLEVEAEGLGRLRNPVAAGRS